MKISSLNITKQDCKNGWQNYKIERIKKKNKKQVIKKKSGGFISRNKYKNVFIIAFNGKRFAQGKELKSLEKTLPSLSKKIKQAIMENLI